MIPKTKFSNSSSHILLVKFMFSWKMMRIRSNGNLNKYYLIWRIKVDKWFFCIFFPLRKKDISIWIKWTIHVLPTSLLLCYLWTCALTLGEVFDPKKITWWGQTWDVYFMLAPLCHKPTKINTKTIHNNFVLWLKHQAAVNTQSH